MSSTPKSYQLYSFTASLRTAMSDSDSFVNRKHAHLVFLPSGIGSLTPFLRLASMVASRNCRVTFINIQPQSPRPEFTSFFADHPRIELLDVEVNSDTPSNSTSTDPFITRFQNINCSLHQLTPFLSSSQVSAIFSDFVIAATLSQISVDLDIPFYVLSTTSAQFFSLVAYLPIMLEENPNVFSSSFEDIEIQGLEPIPKSSIPLAWMHTNYLLTEYLLPNARSLPKVKGVLLNTFDWFEAHTIAALNSGRVLKSLPPVFPIGPLQSYEPQESNHLPLWLKDQPAESVVYVNFGSREVISADQIRELEKGLQICGYNYLWVMKGSNEEEHDKLSGNSYPEKRGIIRGEVDQEKVLANPAIGGFLNQCEWDSVMQAARHGVPILAWPQHGDQKMNAETVEKAGLGVWVKEWGWGGEKLVEGEEISRMLAWIMGDSSVKKKAKFVKEKAMEACGIGESSERVLLEVIEMFTSKDN